MLAGAIEQIVNEMKRHPFTMLVVIGLLAYAFFSNATYATEQDVKQLVAKIDTNNSRIERVLTLQIAESLRTLQKQLCAANTGLETDALQRTIETLQSDYISLTRSRYPLQSCRQ